MKLSVPLLNRPKFKSIHESIMLAKRVSDLEYLFEQVLIEGRYHPSKAVDAAMGHLNVMIKRNDPLLQTHSTTLAKTLITLVAFDQVLTKNTTRPALVLRDIFGHVVQKKPTNDRPIAEIKQAIDRSFATRKMKANLGELVDDIYDAIEPKVRSKANLLRALAIAIKRSARSADDRRVLDQLLAQLLERNDHVTN